MDVNQQPILTLVAWRVFEVNPGETRHFVGWCVENQEGRVSSEIQSFDKVNGLAVTGSGRQYRISGEPGWDDDARYTWGRWLTGQPDISSVVDVTDEVWAQMVRAQEAED